MDRSELPELRCECDNDGLSRTCQLLDDCYYCSDNGNNVMNDCFNFTYTMNYDPMDLPSVTSIHSIARYIDLQPSSNSSSVNSSSINGNKYGNAEIVVGFNLNPRLWWVDLCSVMVNEELCASCEVKSCNDNSIGYVVDCENHSTYPSKFDGCNESEAIDSIFQVLIPLNYGNVLYPGFDSGQNTAKHFPNKK